MCRIIARVPFVSRPEVDGKCGFSDWIFFCWESNKNDVEMGLLPNQIASCIDKLSWCFA